MHNCPGNSPPQRDYLAPEIVGNEEKIAEAYYPISIEVKGRVKTRIALTATEMLTKSPQVIFVHPLILPKQATHQVAARIQSDPVPPVLLYR